MRCLRIYEMIERFYEDNKDPILNEHINNCWECRKVFDTIYLLDRVVLNRMPSNKTEERILTYAFKAVLYNPFYYMKKISISFALATLFIIYVFPSNNKMWFSDEFIKKASDVEKDLAGFELQLYFSSDISSYLNIQKEEL